MTDSSELNKNFGNRKREAPDRWYLDRGAIPGEPAYYLDIPDVPNDDSDKAAGIISEVGGKGFDAVAVINGDDHHLGRFQSVEQAKDAVEQTQANYSKLSKIPAKTAPATD
jgi:hypothetical protein